MHRCTFTANIDFESLIMSLDFYSATLCVSAVFAVSRCLSVSLSVCLSVTLKHCIHMTEDIVKLIYRPGSPSY